MCWSSLRRHSLGKLTFSSRRSITEAPQCDSGIGMPSPMLVHIRIAPRKNRPTMNSAMM